MITLHACAACGHTVFPARQLCAQCGGAVWIGVPCNGGTIAAVTMAQQNVLAELRTPQNVRVIVRLPGAMPPGTSVALHEAANGALWGKLTSRHPR